MSRSYERGGLERRGKREEAGARLSANRFGRGFAAHADEDDHAGGRAPGDSAWDGQHDFSRIWQGSSRSHARRSEEIDGAVPGLFKTALGSGAVVRYAATGNEEGHPGSPAGRGNGSRGSGRGDWEAGSQST